MSKENCPCGLGQEYKDCCAPFIQGKTQPETCEQLMRSRYSAYVKGAVNYLVETTHPNARDKGLARSIEASMRGIKWLGLEIASTQAGTAADQIGKVEFTARFEDSGKPGHIHELSRFRRFEGNWVYLDGELYS